MAIGGRELGALGGFGTGFFTGLTGSMNRNADLLAELERERRKEQMKKYGEMMDILNQQPQNGFTPSQTEMGAMQLSKPYDERSGANAVMGGLMSRKLGTVGEALQGSGISAPKEEAGLPSEMGIPGFVQQDPALMGEYVGAKAERRVPGSTRGGRGGAEKDIATRVKTIVDAIKAGKPMINNSIEGLGEQEKKDAFASAIVEITSGGRTLTPEQVNIASISVGLGRKYGPNGEVLWK